MVPELGSLVSLHSPGLSRNPMNKFFLPVPEESKLTEDETIDQDKNLI